MNDLSYDILTILQSKLDATAIYDTYMEDADEAADPKVKTLFEQIKKDDERHVEQLTAELERLVKEGKFR